MLKMHRCPEKYETWSVIRETLYCFISTTFKELTLQRTSTKVSALGCKEDL